MTVAIEFDVPLDVVDEMTQAITVVLRAINRVEKSAEHLRDDVFAAVKEGCQDLFGRTRIGQGHRMRTKALHMPRRGGQPQRQIDRSADRHQRAKLLELPGI